MGVCRIPKDFNPRSPHGERQTAEEVAEMDFTISIHAPRTGSDAPFAAINPPTIGFQSTLPARGATQGYVVA